MSAKTKEEIISALKGMEGGADFIEGFNALLKDAATNAKSVTEMTKEIASLKEAKQALTVNYNKLHDHIGLPEEVKDLDAALKELREKAKDDVKTNGVEIVALNSQMNELKRSLKAANDKNAALEKASAIEKSKRQAMIRDIELRAALEKNKALNPQITANLMRDNVKVLEDDRVVYTSADGSEVTVDEGVRGFLEKYPEFLANHQKPGAGGGYGGGSGNNIKVENMSPAEYRKLREEGKLA